MHTLRDATMDDVPLLCAAERLVVQSFEGMLVSEPDELQESSFADRLNAIAFGKGRYLVAIEDQLLVGHACLWPMGLRKVSHVLRLDMCIHVGHWRRGHGERLLRELISWARRDSGAHKIELLVRSENGPALALYRKLGFTEEGRLKHRIKLRSGKFVDDITMALFLHDA